VVAARPGFTGGAIAEHAGEVDAVAAGAARALVDQAELAAVGAGLEDDAVLADADHVINAACASSTHCAHIAQV